MSSIVEEAENAISRLDDVWQTAMDVRKVMKQNYRVEAAGMIKQCPDPEALAEAIDLLAGAEKRDKAAKSSAAPAPKT